MPVKLRASLLTPKCISTLRGTTENDPSSQHSPQYAGDFAPNLRQRRGACFPGSAEITVVLPSKKLTLKEDRLAKQIICHSKKTESPIRILRSGSETAPLSTTLSKLSGCPLRANGRWMKR